MVYSLGLSGGVDVQGTRQVVAHGVDHIYHPQKVVTHVVVVRLSFVREESGRGPCQEAHDVADRMGDVGRRGADELVPREKPSPNPAQLPQGPRMDADQVVVAHVNIYLRSEERRV